MRGVTTVILVLAALATTPLATAALAEVGFAQGPWLGQEPPGTEPVIFAPGLVSTGLHERDILVHPDGRTIWYGTMAGTIVTVLETRLVDGRWTEPAQVPFHTDRTFACFEPTLSANGRQVLFLSNRAAPGQEQAAGWGNQNLFRSRRTAAGGWSEPEAVPAPVTTDAAEYFPCLATDGTLYFTRQEGETQAVWSAEPDGDRWAEPVKLPAEVNITDHVYNVYCPPDESWISGCVADHPDNLGPVDYWISFRGEDGAWLPAVNLGEPYNGEGLRANSVSLSPDGRYFFFASHRVTVPRPADDEPITRADLLAGHGEPGGGSLDIWWVDAAVLEGWRP